MLQASASAGWRGCRGQRELAELLDHRLAELPVRRRGSVGWYPAEVSVVAALHGPADGPARDAVLREVLDG
jgi:hypothetical protein